MSWGWGRGVSHLELSDPQGVISYACLGQGGSFGQATPKVPRTTKVIPPLQCPGPGVGGVPPDYSVISHFQSVCFQPIGKFC